MASHNLRAPARVPLKTVALPNEHGAWPLLLEPALLALLVAPSVGGIFFAIAGLTAMLAQHPFALVLTDRRRGKTYPRTRVALRFAAGYGAVAASGAAIAVATSGRPLALAPLLLAVPLALVQLEFDSRNRGRSLVPELAGTAAVGALASCIALAAGWSVLPALGLWLVVVLRSVPSVLWVRARLALAYGRDADRRPAAIVVASAAAIAAALAFTGVLPWLVFGGTLLLLVRGAWGISRFRMSTTPKGVGIRESIFGLVYVLLAAGGYAFGL